MNPEIATILENGTYGQRPMTNEEYAQYLETIGAHFEGETQE
jgi:hypothetical protein